MHEPVSRDAVGDPTLPKTWIAFGGKFGIDDDTETPNTITAGFSYGNQQLVIELRGKMTNGEGVRHAPVVTAGRSGGAPAGANAQRAGGGAPWRFLLRWERRESAERRCRHLFYASNGWAAMSDNALRLTRAIRAN